MRKGTWPAGLSATYRHPEQHLAVTGSPWVSMRNDDSQPGAVPCDYLAVFTLEERVSQTLVCPAFLDSSALQKNDQELRREYIVMKASRFINKQLYFQTLRGHRGWIRGSPSFYHMAWGKCAEMFDSFLSNQLVKTCTPLTAEHRVWLAFESLSKQQGKKLSTQRGRS